MHRRSGSDHKIASDMGGENMAQGKKARKVDHSGDDTEQSGQPLFQAR